MRASIPKWSEIMLDIRLTKLATLPAFSFGHKIFDHFDSMQIQTLKLAKVFVIFLPSTVKKGYAVFSCQVYTVECVLKL